MRRPIITQQNYPCSVDSLRSAGGVVSELFNPRFLPNSYYLMTVEGGPSTSGAFPEFCQSVPFSIFHKPGACRPFFIVTNVGCYGRQMYFTTDIIPTDARTFFSRQSNNQISPVVSLSIQENINKSAIPGPGRRFWEPAFLSFRNPARQRRDSGLQITYKLRECYNLSGAAPIIAVSPITQIGISRSFPAQSITCRSVRQYPIINLIPQRFFFLRDGENFGWVTTWCDPMKRAAHFLVLSTGVSHKLSFVFPDMESEPQCDFHKGLKGNCGSTLHDRRTFSAREHTPLLRSFRKFGRACSVHRQMGRAAFFWNTPALNAAAIIPIRKYPENYAPLENGPESRLHNFRVGVAFLGKGDVPYSRCPFSDTHAASAYSTSGVNHRDGLALKSGNLSTDGVNVIPAVPIFDFSTTTYAAVIRSVSAYGNSDEKDSLYDSAETFAPRFGFNGLKKAAAQLLTDAVSTQASIRTYFHNQITGTASVFSYLTPTNQGTAATNPLNSTTGGMELRSFPLLHLKPTNRQVQQGQHDDFILVWRLGLSALLRGEAFVRRKPLRLSPFFDHKLTLYRPPRRMWNAAGPRGGFPIGSFPCEIASLRSSLRTEAAPFLRSQRIKHTPCPHETPTKALIKKSLT